MSTAAETPNAELPDSDRLEVMASNDSTTSDSQAETTAESAGGTASAPVSVGGLLRDAREKLGLSSGDIATKLRMGLKQVVALENSDYAAVPTGTFLRGFVRNYAKAVSLNADEVLALLEKTHSGAAAVKASSVVVPSLQNIKVPAPGGELATPNGRALAVGVVVLLLLAAAWYWWEYVFPYRNEGGRVNKDAAQSLVVPQLPSQAPAKSNSATETALPTSVSTPAVADGSPPRLTSDALPLQPVISSEAGTIANHAATQPSTAAPIAIPLSSVTASSSESPSAPAPIPTAPPTTPPTAPQTTPGARSAALGFTFSGESWVEVVDASGKTILSRRFKAGDAEEVFGRAPFSVVIGNAKSTRMAFNGREFALEPHTRVTVARVTVK